MNRSDDARIIGIVQDGRPCKCIVKDGDRVANILITYNIIYQHIMLFGRHGVAGTRRQKR